MSTSAASSPAVELQLLVQRFDLVRPPLLCLERRGLRLDTGLVGACQPDSALRPRTPAAPCRGGRRCPQPRLRAAIWIGNPKVRMKSAELMVCDGEIRLALTKVWPITP